jgi:hypothetical protein
MTRLHTLDKWRSNVQFLVGADVILFADTSRLALGPTQPPVQDVLRIKLPRSEADHSPPSSDSAENEWS